MPNSSITTSLELLAQTARERAEQERRDRQTETRRREIEALAARRRRLRIEQSQRRAEAERRHQARLEAQREAARREGIRQGEKIRARIEATHAAELDTLRLAAQQELAALETDTTRSSRPWLAVLTTAAALLVGALWTTPASPATATATMSHVAATRTELVRLQTAKRATELALEGAHAELARLSMAHQAIPHEAAEEAPAASPATRWRAPVPASRPAPVPATPAPATCTDGIGDPCCAFGELIC